MSKRKEQANGSAKPSLEQRLGYTFQDRALLSLALTHRSHVYEARGDFDHLERNQPGTDNEQLEFLGDAVLELVTTELLLERFAGCAEGELTRIRASLVSRKRMAEMGAELGLGDHLLLGRSAEASGARERPALLANAAEAVIAAMYLDAGRSGRDALAPVRTLARRLLLEPETPAIEAALAGEGRQAMRDAKTLLQERVQAEDAGQLRYVDVGQTGPAHDRRFTVEARLERNGQVRVLAQGEGPSKREAQQQAAHQALNAWPAGAEA